MECNTRYLDFFLGALSPAGFHGYFAQLTAQPGLTPFLIKAGPGCGKSTMMKKLAALGSGTVERIHCSSDPASLDGAVFWEQNTAILDATAPHTLEPACPVAVEQVVSLYHTLDRARMQANAGEVRALFGRCSCLQGRAARYLAAAGALLLENRRLAAGVADEGKARRYAARLAERRMPRQEGPGRESVRLLSAVTPDGILAYRNTVEALADDVIVLRDEYGAVSRVILAELRRQALERGLFVITCRCPLAPEDKIDHLLLPELGLAVLTSNSWHPMEFCGQHNMRCSRFADPEGLRARRQRMRFNQKAAAELLAQTSALQREARCAHNELETYYRSAADFTRVDAVMAETACSMGLVTKP